MSDDRKTVDGVPVKVGDLVWTSRPGDRVRQRKLTKLDLGYWWDMLGPEIYSTKVGAIRGAIKREAARRSKALREARTAAVSIERLRGELKLAGASR